MVFSIGTVTYEVQLTDIILHWPFSEEWNPYLEQSLLTFSSTMTWFVRGHIFCYNIAVLCCRLERGLPYTRKQTIVIYSISLHSYFISRQASTLVDCFDHNPSAFHVDCIYPFNFFTHHSCTGIHGTSRWSRYITSQAKSLNAVRANSCLCQGYIKPNIGWGCFLSLLSTINFLI